MAARQTQKEKKQQKKKNQKKRGDKKTGVYGKTLNKQYSHDVALNFDKNCMRF